MYLLMYCSIVVFTFFSSVLSCSAKSVSVLIVFFCRAFLYILNKNEKVFNFIKVLK